MKIEPKLLEGIIKYHASSIKNPMNGMDYLQVGFYGVTFLKDFGPWTAGYEAYDLTFDPHYMTMTEGHQDEFVRSCEVRLEAMP